MKRQLDAACRQYQVKPAHGAGVAAWPDGLKSRVPSVKLLGKTVQAEKPTLYAPQGMKANNATVRSCGKNLFNMLALKEDELPVNITSVGEGEIVVEIPEGVVTNGYVTTWLPLREFAPGMVVGETYSVSFKTDSPANERIYLQGSNFVWRTGNPRVLTEADLNSIVVFYGLASNAGEGTGNCRISNFQIERGTAATAYEPYFDGGEATAPNLMCAVDGSCQSAYDPQTGEFVNWWWDKMVFDGSDDEPWSVSAAHSSGEVSWNKVEFFVDALPENMDNNACWSNQAAPRKNKQPGTSGKVMIAGISNNRLYIPAPEFVGSTLPLRDLKAAWKEHLAEHPLEVWVARNEPEITNIGAQPLICPTGCGQMVQVAGDVPDCPMEVKYLSHGGNVK